MINALKLILSFDKELYFVVYTSLFVAFFSTILSSIIGVPLAYFVDLSKFKFKKIIISFLNSLVALPTVVVGLFVYSFLSRKGVFGFAGVLFTPIAIIIGQTILGIPIITSIIISGFSKIDSRLYETLTTLGANKFQLFVGILRETKTIIISAILSGFGRIIGEVGVSMMLGGNIRLYTRTLTTAIALETSKGEFSLALSMGIILLTLALIINFLAYLFIKKEDLWKR
ncbi:MAG TPA: ABC transporter permease [Spirochaetota bacterium]|nr:ABC transporter permease [Spirochaetota bacterium]